MDLVITRIKRKIKHAYFGLRYMVNVLQSEDLPSEESANILLQHYQPDPGTSVFCENRIHAPLWDLTIIIPVYNVQDYLAECLESVLNQKTQYTYRVIAVNDGSTDRSSEILESFAANERFSVICQENKGLSSARNTAIQDIFSKYIMFVDSDDVLSEHAVEVLMREAYAANADIVQGSFESFRHETGESLGVTTFQRARYAGSTVNIGGTAWAKVFKSYLWGEICFPENYWYEDTVVTGVVSCLSSRISTLDDIVYRYRIRTGSITAISGVRRKSVDSFWITQCVLSARKCLCISCDAEYYEYLLRQAVMNYKRTAMQPETVKKSIFVLTKEMLRKERPQNYIASEKRYERLDEAVSHGTYNEYRYRCSVWK